MAKLKKFSDEQIASLVKESTSYRDLCSKLGMMGGSSHAIVKKKVEDLNLDTSHFTGKAWNKGFTKETHPSLLKQGETYRKACHKGWLGRKHRLESREKASKSSSERSWTNGIIRTKWFDVFNPTLSETVKVQGTWEKLYVEYLNKESIAWVKNKKTSFTWTRGEGDIKHSYHPDFYLPETDTYIEIKGFMWKSKDGRVDDELKLRLVQEQNPDLKLKILMEDELKSLGILKVNKEGRTG